MSNLTVPTNRDAAASVERLLATPVRAVERFPTGLAHYVFDVELMDGERVVARLDPVSAPATGSAAFAGGIAWSRRLRPLGVPLPRLLAADAAPADGTFPFMLLERLPGNDLGAVYPTLTSSQKRALAQEIAAIQARVGALPLGSGYGFALAYDDPGLHDSWADVIRAHLARSHRQIAAAGIVGTDPVERVRARLPRFAAAFARIPPRPFLDDTTTKNVIVHDGRLSGIVDVDMVCFGDPLLTVALTGMALRSHGYDLDYVDYWCDALDLDAERQAILAFYTALFALDFLSEIGHAFNQGAALTADAAQLDRLGRVVDEMLARI